MCEMEINGETVGGSEVNVRIRWTANARIGRNSGKELWLWLAR